MTDEQLLEQCYNEGRCSGMPPFEALNDEYKKQMRESFHFLIYKTATEAIEFWQALERNAMMNDIKQNNSKK